MPLADYAHWNEEGERVWYEEEGRHEPMPTVDQEAREDMQDADAADAFAEDCAEMSTEQLHNMLQDDDYMARWPKTRPIIEWELRDRG